MHRFDHLAVRQQPLQDVHGHEAVHAAAAHARAAIAFRMGRMDRVRELLGSNFDLAFERGTSFYREPSGEAAWNTFSTGYGPTHSLAESLDDARRAELMRDFVAFHEGFRNELGICVPREYWLTIGVRR